MAPICRFWVQGSCRNGSSCRFEHPSNRNTTNQRNSNHSSRGNERGRFGGGDDHQGQGQPQRGQQGQDEDRHLPYKLNAKAIRDDLTTERPTWIFSSYGPGFRAPAQLFGGLPREQSFEEMRLRYYELAARNQTQQAINEVQKLHETAQEQMRVALQDVDGAIDYIISAEKTHPNRIDVCKRGSQSSISEVFSRQAASGAADASRSGFGRPSVSGSGFGKPSTIGGGFGQPPSSMRAVVTASPQPSSVPNPFRNVASSNVPNPFSRAKDNLEAPSAGGSGVPSTGGFQTASLGGFGAPSKASTESPSGSAPPNSNAFGAASVGMFGTRDSSGFGSSSTGGFGQPPNEQKIANPPEGGYMSRQGVYGDSHATWVSSNSKIPKIADGQPEMPRDKFGRLQSWSGRRLEYLGDGKEPCIQRPDGDWERIWFPNGPPAQTIPQEIPLEYYDEQLHQQYQYLAEHGEFKNGVIPQFPPKSEWTSWDF